MKGEISFTNLTKKRISYARLRRIYECVLPGWEVSVVFAGAARMRSLNKKYRKKDKVANVLSFKLGPRAGEIFLHVGEKDISHLFVHACLHLKGFDHQNEKTARAMEKQEQNILLHIKK